MVHLCNSHCPSQRDTVQCRAVTEGRGQRLQAQNPHSGCRMQVTVPLHSEAMMHFTWAAGQSRWTQLQAGLSWQGAKGSVVHSVLFSDAAPGTSG